MRARADAPSPDAGTRTEKPGGWRDVHEKTEVSASAAMLNQARATSALQCAATHTSRSQLWRCGREEHGYETREGGRKIRLRARVSERHDEWEQKIRSTSLSWIAGWLWRGPCRSRLGFVEHEIATEYGVQVRVFRGPTRAIQWRRGGTQCEKRARCKHTTCRDPSNLGQYRSKPRPTCAPTTTS